MTDIRRHLPGIFSCIRSVLSLSTPSLSQQELMDALTTLLPTSYGIGTGCLVNAQGVQSLSLDIIIYDKTIPSSQDLHTPHLYELRQALIILTVLCTPTITDLDNALSSLASAKMLRPTHSMHPVAPTASTSRSVKKFVPLGIIALQQLIDNQTHGQETLCLLLDAALKRQPISLRPDYLIAHNHNLSYRNPLLDGMPFDATTLHIACEPDLPKPRHCYICKNAFTRRHFFYTQLCLSCGDYNYQKRSIPTHLNGRIALVTGGRLKIGYATALRLLRAGAQVIVTTRFPHDAAQRYSNEPDFASWQDRLQIYGLDMRHLPTVEHFIDHLHATYPTLDILINNAAQTVRRPPAYYAHLLPQEHAPLTTLPPTQQALVAQSHRVLPPSLPTLAPGELVAIPELRALVTQNETGADARLFPAGQYDADGQQIDLRQQNSWTQSIDDIGLTELLEVQVINVTAPFLLISRLRALMKCSPFPRRFIINVSAAEGQFSQSKLGTHPHTNMAKAALNMLTRTIASDFMQGSIFVNSVDPGWISQQSPRNTLQTAEEQKQAFPLDVIDAAARICDPIFTGITTEQVFSGGFYKDYKPTDW